MKRVGLSEIPKHVFIWLMLVASLFPLYVMAVISVKDNRQFFNHPWIVTLPLHLQNWSVAWNQVGGTILNSVFLCISSTIIVLVFGLMAGYFFGRFHMPGKNVLWAMFMTLMMMPAVINLVPLFNLLKTLGWLNSYITLVMLFVTGGQVVCVFLLRGFIEDLPQELFEAAEMDGASHVQRILHIVFPMSLPIISTLAILRFIASWNQFVLPLIVLRDEAKFPISVKLYQLEGAYLKEWGPLMAGYALAAIPLIVLFLFTMRYFVKGLSSGAVKG